ncbi:hypothetical protein HanRHA438_Chr04g0171171 [Helianthus annuus]|nr:hypothetical protein HanIR_Chr04g0173981 [Helianthus annuus]KAJ0926437.1 hypothetical protein HanRHA438_Chr04g0171171 [Helianthus annuus]
MFLFCTVISVHERSQVTRGAAQHFWRPKANQNWGALFVIQLKLLDGAPLFHQKKKKRRSFSINIELLSLLKKKKKPFRVLSYPITECLIYQANRQLASKTRNLYVTSIENTC